MNTTQENTVPMEQAAQWMSRLGALDTPDWNNPEFSDWLAQSARHREAFAEVSALWFAAEQIAPPNSPASESLEQSHDDSTGDSLGDSMGDSMGNQWEPLAAPRYRTSRWRPWAGLAFVLVALLVLPTLPQRWAAMQSDYVTQRGEITNVTLSDGSTVQMAGFSAFSQSSNGRGIDLHYGEVFLQVTHDPQDPFVVSAGDAEVTVLGTQFGVAWRDGEHRAGVVSGRVSVTVAKQPPIQLGPGQFSVNGAQVDPPQQDAFSWRSGNLVFADAPLSQVLDQLAPFLSQRVIQMPGANDPTVTAVVSLSVGDQMLETLAESTGLQLLTAGPVTLLY